VGTPAAGLLETEPGGGEVAAGAVTLAGAVDVVGAAVPGVAVVVVVAVAGGFTAAACDPVEQPAARPAETTAAAAATDRLAEIVMSLMSLLDAGGSGRRGYSSISG
jgi:hypothetical protein